MTCTRPKVVVCGFADTMVLVAKESYALSVTLSALKRRACLIVNKCQKDQYIIKKIAEIRKISYICSVIKKTKEVNMLTTRTKVRGFKAVTIKNIPTRIATRHYFAYQKAEGREIKIVLTKKSF